MERIVRLKSKYHWVLFLIIPLIFGAVSLSEAGELCISVDKWCTDAGGPGQPIEFGGTVSNCGEENLFYVTVTDDHDPDLLLEVDKLLPGQSVDFSGSYVPQECPSKNTVTATGGHGPYTLTATAEATCDCGYGQGCTPGFWRNHIDAWVGYNPGDDFDTTFGVDLFDPNITLEQAIWAKGGGVKKLARHGTAALLSAAHPDVAYPLTEAEVIAAVQAGDAETLANYNDLGAEDFCD